MKLNIKRNLKKKTHREKINNFFFNVHPSSSRDEENENEKKRISSRKTKLPQTAINAVFERLFAI